MYHLCCVIQPNFQNRPGGDPPACKGYPCTFPTQLAWSAGHDQPVEMNQRFMELHRVRDPSHTLNEEEEVWDSPERERIDPWRRIMLVSKPLS